MSRLTIELEIPESEVDSFLEELQTRIHGGQMIYYNIAIWKEN